MLCLDSTLKRYSGVFGPGILCWDYSAQVVGPSSDRMSQKYDIDVLACNCTGWNDMLFPGNLSLGRCGKHLSTQKAKCKKNKSVVIGLADNKKGQKHNVKSLSAKEKEI